MISRELWAVVDAATGISRRPVCRDLLRKLPLVVDYSPAGYGGRHRHLAAFPGAQIREAFLWQWFGLSLSAARSPFLAQFVEPLRLTVTCLPVRMAVAVIFNFRP